MTCSSVPGPGRRRLLWAGLAFSVLLGPVVPQPSAAKSLLPCIELGGVNDRCPVWRADYDGPGAGDDTPGGAAAAPDGSRLFVTGYTSDVGADIDRITIAYESATGRELWQHRAGGPGLQQGVAVAAGRMIYTVGSTCADLRDGSTCDLVTMAYDQGSPTPVWVDTFDGAGGMDAGFDVTVDSTPGGAERVYVAGRTFDPASDVDFLTMAFDGATGDLLWRRRFDGSGGGFDGATAVALDPSTDRLYVAGPAEGSAGNSALSVVSYDKKTGAEAWAASHETGVGQDLPNDLVVAGGRVFVSGTRHQTGALGPVPDVETTAFDGETGRELWSAAYNGPASGPDFALALVAAPDGSTVYVGGMSRGTGYDLLVLAYDGATGARRWDARYNGPYNNGDAAWSVGLAPDERTVYAGGTTFVEGLGYRDVVGAFDSETGGRAWIAIGEGAGRGQVAVPSPLVVDPLGRYVYLAGRSGELTGLNPDISTVAYSTTSSLLGH